MRQRFRSCVPAWLSPVQEFLDSADGQAALATLRLAHGEVMWRYRRALPVVNATPAQRQQTEEIVADAVRQGTQALAQMRTGEAQHEHQLYLEGARSGERRTWQHVLGVFSPAQQEVLAAFLASLHEREHTPGDISTVPGVEGAAPIAATAACMVARQCQRHFCSVPRQAVPVWLP